MLISVKNRFVFIAGSKTASTSIEDALTPYAEINRVGSAQRKHIIWREARKEYNFLFNNSNYDPKTFFKFGVVREPAEWIISWYNYRYMNKRIDTPLPENITFKQYWNSNDWVKNLSQKNHFISSDNICRFNLIIPHEKVNQAFPLIVEYLNLGKVILPHANKSPAKRIVRSSLDPAMISEINTYYQQDFDFWTEWMEKIDNTLENLIVIKKINSLP